MKKAQVVIPDWLDEFMKLRVKDFGLTCSALIRLDICMAFLAYMAELYPEYKPGISNKKICTALEACKCGSLGEDEVEKMLSKIQFETRKGVEHIMSTRSGIPGD